MNRQTQIEIELRQTTAVKNYNGWKNKKTEFGYHSFYIDEIKIRGQRNPKERIDIFSKSIDFNNKVVVDFGCNVGGMLFHLPDIKKGYGFDFAKIDIQAANNIKKILNRPELFFHVVDVDTVKNFNDLNKFYEDRPNVFFLLSIGGWMKNHLRLYEYCADQKGEIILELNDQFTDQHQIEFFKSKGYSPILINPNSNDDIEKKYRASRASYYIDCRR